MRRFTLLLVLLCAVWACVPRPPAPPTPPTPPSCPACPAVTVPDGCPPCPPQPPPPPVTTGHLEGIAVDGDGNPLPMATITYILAGQELAGGATAVPNATPTRPLAFFSRPGSETFGTYRLRATLPDGRQATSADIVFDKTWKAKPISFPIPKPPIPDRALLAKHMTPAAWLNGFSYYGCMSGDDARWEEDASTLQRYNVNHVRCWPDFERAGVEFRTFDRQGNTTAVKIARLHRFVDIMARHGISTDLTFACDAYDFTKKSEEGYDIGPHKKAIARVVTEFKGDPAIAVIDVCNEGRKRGGSSGCNGSPEWGHISPGRFLEIFKLAQSIDPSRRISVSSDGDATKDSKCGNDSIAYFYKSIEGRGIRLPVLLPHFPRTASAPQNEGKNVAALRANTRPDVLIYNHEPFRRGHPGRPGVKPNDSNAGNWSADHFILAIQEARKNKSLGFCLHSDDAFVVNDAPLDSKIDPVERKVLEYMQANP